MDISTIKELIKVIDESSLTTFEMEQEGVKLVMKKEGVKVSNAVATQAPVVIPQISSVAEEVAPVVDKPIVTEPQVDGKKINSPMVGTFYASSAPDKPPYVKVGDRVKKGQVVCIVEAMKLMNEIESDVEGEIVEILVNNEDMVEYGQAMFVVR